MANRGLASSLEKSKATQMIVALLDWKKSMSFTELMREINANPRTLADRIDELSQYKIISVEKEKSFPFKETISLTDKGRELAQRIKIAYMSIDSNISNRAKILLHMMYVLGGEIIGTTKLEKLPFLLEKEFEVNLGYHYDCMEYGPYSIELLNEINILQMKGYISIREELVPIKEKGTAKTVERRTYCLTEKGKEKNKKIIQELDQNIRNSIEKIRKYNNMNLNELLDYVHKKYPEYRKTNKNC
ncbi:MAG: winged helix-turn-helix transcriptional regulator [Candidatus Thermoplasmatota archaeon]